MEEDLEGKMGGIGVHMTMRNRLFIITGVIPGSPAQAAGLRPGDVFVQVEGKDVLDLSMDRLKSLVRGKPGTPVQLQMHREGEPRPLDFTITRAIIEVPDVTWHMLPDLPIAHVAIKDFGEQAKAQLQKAVQEAVGQGAKGLLVEEWLGWRAVGLNERFRFYRYDPGQRFAPHTDGSFQRGNGELSQFTFLVYMNDGFEGGATAFHEGRTSLLVTPERGKALVFYHRQLHEGTPVVRGRKYVLRTDIMYRYGA